MSLLVRWLAGLLLGAGLLLSGMATPSKVLAFLDLGAIPHGGWDPSLALVLGGAVAVAAPGFRLARHLRRPLLGGHFDLPPTSRLDARLFAGAAIFGIGWGLVGLCPGPALLLLGSGDLSALGFVAAMLLGMAAARRLARPRAGAGVRSVPGPSGSLPGASSP